MKFTAPEGTTSCSVGGETFNVDEDGCITVPDTGDYSPLLSPHGFVVKSIDASEASAVKEAELEKEEAEAAAKEAEETELLAEIEAAEKAKAEAEAAAKSTSNKAAQTSNKGNKK